MNGGHPKALAPPVRTLRPFALNAMLGWNGLVGLGFSGAYSFAPAFTLDLALGLSLVGGKVGMRGRYNVSEEEWSPTFGIGVNHTSGTDGVQKQSDDNGEVEFTIDASTYAQLFAGMNYQSRDGLAFMGGLGYSILLGKNNVHHVSGDRDRSDLIKRLGGNGLVLEFSLGYGF